MTEYDENLSNIVIGIKQGKESSFRKFYDLYFASIYAHALRVCKVSQIAEDVVQDTFTTIWEERLKLDPDLSVKSYLFAIMRNKLLNKIAKAAREPSLAEEMLESVKISNVTEEDLQYHETSRILQEAIERLPKHRQKIYRMTREQGLSYQETANELGLSRGTINTQMMRSLKSIKEYLTLHGTFS